jgi:hypothetical protein
MLRSRTFLRFTRGLLVGLRRKGEAAHLRSLREQPACCGIVGHIEGGGLHGRSRRRADEREKLSTFRSWVAFNRTGVVNAPS